MSLVSIAMAAPASGQAAQGSPLGSLLFLGVFVLLFYFLFFRPQQKRAKDHRTMVDKLAKGDEVVTSGGILGKITHIDDSFIRVEIANGVEITIQKGAISSLVPKGTLGSA